MNVEILHGTAATDHKPISVMLDIEKLPDKSLGNIQIPYDVFLCDNINCDNSNHNGDLCNMYDEIVMVLNNASKSFCNKRSKRPGWNEHVSELHQQAFKNWPYMRHKDTSCHTV